MTGWPRISPAVFHKKAVAEIDWLTPALGFAVRENVQYDKGQIVPSQLVLDGGPHHGVAGRLAPGWGGAARLAAELAGESPSGANPSVAP